MIKHNFDLTTLPTNLDYSLSTAAILSQLAGSVASRPPSFSFQSGLFSELVSHYAPSSSIAFFPSLFTFSTYYDTFLSSSIVDNLDQIYNSPGSRPHIPIAPSDSSIDVFTAPSPTSSPFHLYHDNLFPSVPGQPNIQYDRLRAESVQRIFTQVALDELTSAHFYEILDLIIGGIFFNRVNSSRTTVSNSRNPPFLNPRPENIQTASNPIFRKPIANLSNATLFHSVINVSLLIF